MRTYFASALAMGVCAALWAGESATMPAPPVVETGVYRKHGEQWREMLPEVVHWKTGGILKMLATGGIVKGDVNGRLQGPESRNAVDRPAEFLIYAPEGVAITEYQLIRLRCKKEAREFRTVTGGILHVSGGAMRDLVPFKGRRIAPRTWVVELPGLAGGEYGFLPPGMAMSSHASASLGKIYSFRLAP